MYQVKNGYQTFQRAEPLMLEPEDWNIEEWATLCKLCGFPAGQIERIVMNVREIECFADTNKSAPGDRTHTVTEWCPHCESEVEMRWDTDTMGFFAFCPVCGKRLMLCDECTHTEENISCNYDTETDTCRYNLKNGTSGKAKEHHYADCEEKLPSNQNFTSNSRMKKIANKAIDYFGELLTGESLYDCLADTLGMTDKEILAADFTTLKCYMKDDEDDCMQ